MATYYKPTFNIDLTLLEPGAIATNFTNAVLGHVQQTAGILDDEYKPMISRYLESFQARNSPPPPKPPNPSPTSSGSCCQLETKPLRVRTSEAAEAFCKFKVEQDPTGLDGLLNTRKLHLRL